jgi:hypothetical protein
MTTQTINWSLQSEIRSRKVHGILRTIENQQVARTKTHAERELIAKAAEAQKVRPVRKMQSTIQGTAIAQSAASIQAGSLTKGHRRTVILAGIIVLAGGALITLLTLLLNSQSAPQAAFIPLPVVSASAVVDHFKETGMPVTNQRAFAAPNSAWTAKEEIQFDVQRGADKGTFIMLSYESAAQAGLDGFTATSSAKFKNWKVMQYSNILTLASPDTAKPIYAEMGNSLTQYLVAPYRSFVATTK